MAEHGQRLTHPAVPGQEIFLPACSEDTDEVYRNDGWVPVTESKSAVKAVPKDREV